MPGAVVARFLPLLLALPLAAADRFDPIRAFIRQELVETEMPSISVAVAKNGKILWEEGFGWADRAKRVPANEHTMYSLASISKPITATGLMLLVQAGKIDLDRPINDYLGNAKLRARVGDAGKATVRRVANHSSGLPLHYQFFYEDESYRPPSMDETILRYGNLVTVPGEKVQYSNLGYGVLDYVISRISGRSYVDFMREEVFLPLGLTHTSVHIGPGLQQYAATRYGRDGLPIPFYEFDHTGASGVWASAHDLVRFGMFHLKAHVSEQKAILSDASIDAMQKPTMKSGNNRGYGIAWAVTDAAGGHRVVAHSGSMGGVATTLRLIPSEKLAVVVLCNGNNRLPHRVSDKIVALLLPQWKPSQRTRPPSSTKFKPPAKLLGEWSGKLHTYKAEIPLTLRVLKSGDVHAKLGNQLQTLLNGSNWRDGYLSGRMTGDIGTEDANRRRHSLRLTLKLRGDVLNGPASAISLPGRRSGNALTQWVELKKQSGGASRSAR
jgi:CubicO group peptidase (beta-lactamase class C family)